MSPEQLKPLLNFGSWQDVEKLRKRPFRRRTPQQRLDWLVQALTIAYQCGALKQPPAETGMQAKPTP